MKGERERREGGREGGREGRGGREGDMYIFEWVCYNYGYAKVFSAQYSTLPADMFIFMMLTILSPTFIIISIFPHHHKFALQREPVPVDEDSLSWAGCQTAALCHPEDNLIREALSTEVHEQPLHGDSKPLLIPVRSCCPLSLSLSLLFNVAYRTDWVPWGQN